MIDLSKFMRLPATLTTVSQSDDRDDMNRPVDEETNTEIRCWVAPEKSEEITDGRIVSTTRFVGYFPPGTDVAATSKLTLGTATYEVDGPPSVWTDPRTTDVVGITAPLVRTA